MNTIISKNNELIITLHGQKYVAQVDFCFDRVEVLEVDVHSLFDYASGTQLSRLEPNFLAWARAEEVAQNYAREQQQSYAECAC